MGHGLVKTYIDKCLSRFINQMKMEKDICIVKKCLKCQNLFCILLEVFKNPPILRSISKICNLSDCLNITNFLIDFN